MLGPPKSRCLDQPIAVSLEELVPADHFYRHLEAKLDSSFVREWTRELYAERGRPSIDPVVFFKLQLVMFFEGIRSERQLIETASLNLAHRWYLGYALDEELPDHSSLTRIRQRLGIEIFERFFEQVVDLCQEAAWSGAASSTSMRPRSRPTPVSRRSSPASTTKPQPTWPTVRGRSVPDVVHSQIPSTFCPRDRAAADDRGRDPPQSDPPWRLLEERRLDPSRPSRGGYRRTSDFRVSPTDPDASPMWDWGAIRLGYHDHYVVDGGKRRIILAALVTPADVMETRPCATCCGGSASGGRSGPTR